MRALKAGLVKGNRRRKDRCRKDGSWLEVDEIYAVSCWTIEHCYDRQSAMERND